MKQQLIQYLELVDFRLSRTITTGSSDTHVSHIKKPLLYSGSALQERISSNRELAIDYILWRKNWFCTTAREHLLVLCGLAQVVSAGLLPEGLLRAWPYDLTRHGMTIHYVPVPPSDILWKLEELMWMVIEAQSCNEEERLVRIAQIEWEIGIGPIHPFYDGCGRVSRYYSTLLSLWLDVPLAYHSSRQDYFDAASRGIDTFVDYYKTAINYRAGVSDIL